MLINSHNPPFIHGITILDDVGKPLTRVQQFCTETYLCWTTDGKRTVASGYVITCNGPKDVKRYLDTLPDSMQQHIYPEPLEDGVGSDVQKSRLRDFVNQQLAHSARLRALSTPAEAVTDTVDL